MTSQEYLYAYCQLILHGYSHEEAEEIIQKIKRKYENIKHDK